MLPAGSTVGTLYDKVKTQPCAPEDGRNYRPKRVEVIEIINKIIIVASSWLFILLYIGSACEPNSIIFDRNKVSLFTL